LPHLSTLEIRTDGALISSSTEVSLYTSAMLGMGA